VTAECVDDILHSLVDLVDVERAIAEEERDAELERIAFSIAHAAAGLRFEHRGVHAPAPLVAGRRVAG